MKNAGGETVGVDDEEVSSLWDGGVVLTKDELIRHDNGTIDQFYYLTLLPKLREVC